MVQNEGSSRPRLQPSRLLLERLDSLEQDGRRDPKVLGHLLLLLLELPYPPREARNLGDLYAESGQTLQGSCSAVSKTKGESFQRNSNAYFLAKFGFDTAKNEPYQVCPIEQCMAAVGAGAAGKPPQRGGSGHLLVVELQEAD